MYDACVPWPERPKGAKDKSRGPKGLKLEVGARRAPKLLVFRSFLNVDILQPETSWLPYIFHSSGCHPQPGTCKYCFAYILITS